MSAAVRLGGSVAAWRPAAIGAIGVGTGMRRAGGSAAAATLPAAARLDFRSARRPA
ncbi:hypothetical protein [Methylobacterium tardum]|uniref:hypothetical protein n=1 Tax=Methylobacterium tardum TaxID=374432 RepID=UPI0020224932|nr:hypothetical protein [Methylobacterium tardum]URD36794.1 hypothetical protein M6G65_31535 [Methylobacterium tardum]